MSLWLIVGPIGNFGLLKGSALKAYWAPVVLPAHIPNFVPHRDWSPIPPFYSFTNRNCSVREFFFFMQKNTALSRGGLTRETQALLSLLHFQQLLLGNPKVFPGWLIDLFSPMCPRGHLNGHPGLISPGWCPGDILSRCANNLNCFLEM